MVSMCSTRCKDLVNRSSSVGMNPLKLFDPGVKKYSAMTAPLFSMSAMLYWMVDVFRAKIMGLFEKSGDIVIEDDDHEENEQEKPHFLGPFTFLEAEGSADDEFDQQKQDNTTI